MGRDEDDLPDYMRVSDSSLRGATLRFEMHSGAVPMVATGNVHTDTATGLD